MSVIFQGNPDEDRETFKIKIINPLCKVLVPETYLIELTNGNAYRLLEDLEELKIIKVLKKNKLKAKEIRKSGTAGFRGALKLSEEQYLNFQQHAKDIRNEWQIPVITQMGL